MLAGISASRASGAWETRVSGGVAEAKEVMSVVFPEPEGPRITKVGIEIAAPRLKMKLCSRIGMVKMAMTAAKKPSGEGAMIASRMSRNVMVMVVVVVGDEAHEGEKGLPGK
jgi:hypothetical protein